MRHRFKLPKPADTAENFVTVEWKVAAGDNVSANDPLVLAEADKTEVEIAVPFRGTIVELLPSEDEEVNTGDAICVIEGDL